MAKVIGHHKLWYRTVCHKCKAIILFDENELTNHDTIDRFNEPIYNYSTCICPECETELSFNKRYASFEENTDEPIREVIQIKDKNDTNVVMQIDRTAYVNTINAMKVLVCDDADYETCHREADNILLKFLESIGCNELAKTFDAIGKWYS